VNDWMEQNGEDAVGYQLMGENIQRSRLRIDARKWVASKLKPKKYGDRIDHTSTDGSMTPQPTVSAIERLTDRIKSIEERGRATGEPASE